MIEYHKIQSIFLRDPNTKNKKFLMGQFTLPAFEYLKNNIWDFTEKFDGTNVRVVWDGKDVHFGGRTGSAQMPVILSEYLRNTFTAELMQSVFPEVEGEVSLFGEGFGKGIQKGGDYLPHVEFILFDVHAGGLYLERNNVDDIASKLSIRFVPVVGSGTLQDAIDFASKAQPSTIGTARSEGIVVRPRVEMQTRRGERIITKLKYRDFN
jgi:hypothetical protein